MRNGTAAVWLAVAALFGTIMAYWSSHPSESIESPPLPSVGEISAPAQSDDPFAAARGSMVERQLRDRDINNVDVLRAMGRVPRHEFVPVELWGSAYADHPLPIGFGQTISQPYIVALMTQAAKPTAQSRALEIGLGSGYQTAVLAELCKEVYGIEILRPLADAARARLASLGYKNVTVECRDGYNGWRDHAPFDVILVTAAPNHVPEPLIEQLALGGRLVIPVGRVYQELLLIKKKPDGSLHRESVAPVLFVPMIGEAGQDQR
jgi:protein-L-isoaspartate(D-aspartate) O-methyltransferase